MMKMIVNDENDWDNNVEGDAFKDPVISVNREEMLQALNEMKTGKDPGPLEISLELIAASREVRIQMMAEICQS